MTKILFTVNAILTLPFGILALILPEPVFAGYGIVLNDGGQLIARGYAATLIGYGLIYFSMRSVSADMARPLLFASLIFNLIEAVIQGAAGLNSVALPAIWGTVAAHSVMAVLCFSAFMKTKT